MTREEAIKWIDDRMCFGRGTFTDHHPPNIDECWQAGMMAIKALSTESAQKWIPCSERLPEKDELVLATVWNDVVIAWRNRYGGWESAEDMYEKGDVIAWMPLPEPYREEREVE